MKFIPLSGIDPFSEEPDAANTIYVRPENIIHMEFYSGPFGLQAYGPDGKCTFTGKHKQILGGTMVWLGVGGQRIVLETPKAIMELIKGPGFD